MGQTLYFVVAAASLLSITPQMRALHVYTQATTMTSAAHWARVAFAGWVLALTSDWLSPPAESRWSDQMWYLACVLSLTPFAAALGAKRPGTRIWSVFVILPLILVLEWPALSRWNGLRPPEQLELEAPALAALGLVLVMGTGNYLGTRYGWPVLGIVCGIVLQLTPLTEHTSPNTVPDLFWRAAACSCLAVSLWGLGRKTRQVPQHRGLEQLWSDFRDLFGIAWARRVQEQINAIARQEQWGIQLDFQGFVQDSGAPVEGFSDRDQSQIERAFRWSLRRFVDPEWIHARLAGSNTATADHVVDPPFEP